MKSISISLQVTTTGWLDEENKQYLKVTVKRTMQDWLAFFKELKGKYDNENGCEEEEEGKENA